MSEFTLNPPNLSTERLRLIPLSEDDLTERYRAWFDDLDVTRYLSTHAMTMDQLRESARRYLGSATALCYTIRLATTGQHIGNVTVNHVDYLTGMADSGVLIGERAAWRHGYALEAWRACLRYVLTDVGLRKIIAGAVDQHHASRRLMLKLGFRKEGVLRGETWVEGRWCDVVRYGLFAQEIRRS